MYSTLEPCTMFCAGPILASRLAVVVYGTDIRDAQEFNQASLDKSWLTNEITCSEFAARTPWSTTRIIGGFMKGKCSELFSDTPHSAESATTADGQKLHIVSLEPLQAGLTRAQFTIGKQYYNVEAPFDPEGLLSWFPSYVAKAPACTSCERLIFPTQQVAQGHMQPDDSGLSHLECCDTLAGFAGWLDNNAELVPAFPKQ